MNPIRPEETGGLRIKNIICAINKLISDSTPTDAYTCISGKDIKDLVKSNYMQDIDNTDIRYACQKFYLSGWDISRRVNQDPTEFDYYFSPKRGGFDIDGDL